LNPWVIALAPLIGLMLALFGAGGGMLTVPLLTYGLAFPLKQAIAASLWIVAAVSLVALFRQRAWHGLNLKMLAAFAVGGIAGSSAGAHLGMAMSSSLQAAIFGVLVLFVAWWMRRPKPTTQSDSRSTCRCLLTLLAGIALGITTGVLGVGGGFLMVPALIWLGISDYKSAVAHSLVLIVINALTAGLSYASGMTMALTPILMIAGLASLGSLAGGALLVRHSSEHLQSAFSFVLLIIGTLMLGKAFI
jgi:uncharacterized membrane protein YfcA